MRIPIGTALVAGAAVLVGCGWDGEQREPLITEENGLLHVQLPRHELLDAPEWRPREIYNTATSGSGIELFRVAGARFLEDGPLVIANSGSRELLFLNGSGELLRRFGRPGGGPGEFGMLTALDVDGSGNLLAYDPRLSRLTRVTPAGNVLEITSVSSEDAVVDLYPLSELVDGRILAVFGAVRAFGTSEETRDTVPLVIVEPSGMRWDTVAIMPAQEWANFEFPGGVTRAEVGFGRSLAYSGRGGRVAVGSTDSLNVTVFDDNGRHSMQIVGWGSRLAVGAEGVSRWRADLLEQRSQAPEEIRRWLASAPYRDTYPAFEGLLMDDRGRIWIGMSSPAGEPQEWLVLGADGRVEGRMTVPAGARLLDVGGNHVALLRRTDLDEEYVVVMAIE